MRTLSSVCLSAIQSSFYTPRNAKCVIVGFFPAKYRSFMNPRRNEQSPDFKMQFGDSICHSFSGTQTHEDQRPEGLRSPGKPFVTGITLTTLSGTKWPQTGTPMVTGRTVAAGTTLYYRNPRNECTKDSSEQLAYPTMCVDEQETGHGRITVVYPDTEYTSYKEPHEDEHNFSFFTRDEPKNIDTGMQEYCSNSGNGDDSSLGNDRETHSCTNKSKGEDENGGCYHNDSNDGDNDRGYDGDEENDDDDDVGGSKGHENDDVDVDVNFNVDDHDDDDDDDVDVDVNFDVDDHDDDDDDDVDVDVNFNVDDHDDDDDDDDVDDVDDHDDDDDVDVNVDVDDNSSGEEKMEVDNKPEKTDTSSQFEFSPAELDHSSYCHLKDCTKGKCKYVKLQIKYHMKNHLGWEKCPRCKSVSAVIKEHAKQCQFQGCWVEHCDRIRSIDGKKEENDGHLARIKMEEDSEDRSPAALDVAEQYNNTNVGKAAMESHKVDVSPADLQHASYCRKINCHNEKCRDVKLEVNHFKRHQYARKCTRCAYLLSVIQHHAQTCHMRGKCRVPGCENTRNRGNIGYPVPRHTVQRKVPALLTCTLGGGNNLLTPGKCKSQCQNSTSADDGLSSKNPYCGTVLFWHPKRPPVKKVKEDEDYHVQRNQSLGAGVNGTVYPAYWYLESGTREEFAIKKTNFSVEEVKVYEKLEDHPHLVTHYGVAFSSEHKKVNIFMELCDGSLFTYMKELNRRLTDKEAMNFFIQVLIAVCYLHSLGIIHKDLKAKNIMRKGNVAKVGDFDTAKILKEEMTEAGLHPRGTRGFAALEVMAMKPHGRPADVFSLGVLLLELTVGAPSEDPESLVLKIKELEAKYADLAKLVKACVQEDPMLRPTASSLLHCEIVGNYRSLNSDLLPCL